MMVPAWGKGNVRPLGFFYKGLAMQSERAVCVRAAQAFSLSHTRIEKGNREIFF